MPYLLALALVLTLFLASTLRRCIVFEYQRGLLYRLGKFVRVLQPGAHLCFRPLHSWVRIDVRAQTATIPGQEVLTADNVGIKVSLATSYKVADPYLAVNQVVSYQEAIYLLLQLNLRDIVGSPPIDELLAKRAEIGKALFDRSAEKAREIGVELILVNIKDIMFPGELKSVFAQVVSARNEGLAALERARGEGAALRSLANAAKLFDENPGLRQLRLLQVLENKTGNTVVFMSPEGLLGLQDMVKKQ